MAGVMIGESRRRPQWGRWLATSCAVAFAVSLVDPQVVEAGCPPRYTVTIVGPWECSFPYPDNGTAGTAMNPDGVVTGYTATCSTLATLPFIWTLEDSISALPFPPGQLSGRAYGINDAGMVVGRTSSFLNENIPLATVWPPGQAPILVGTMPGGNTSTLYDVNNSGTAVGYWHNSNNMPRHVLLWKDGEKFDLGPLTGWSNSVAHAVNDQGVIAGFVGDIYEGAGLLIDGDEVVIVPPLPGDTSMQFRALGESGIAGGESELFQPGQSPALVRHPVLYADGKLQALENLPTYTKGTVLGVNSAGDAVGFSEQSSAGLPMRAVLWHEGKVHQLNDLLIDSTAVVTDAWAILDDGRILAHGDVPSVTSGALVLTPVPRLGDVTGDGCVDASDLAALLTDWGRRGSAADLDKSGVVDGGDLGLLLGDWG